MKKKKDIIDFIVKIILIIIIIILLLHNCSLMKKRENTNVDIIEIKCDKDTCKSKQIKSLSFTDTVVSIKRGDKTKLIVTINPSELSDSKLTWNSSNSKIVSVDKNGTIKGIGIGSAVITVTSANGKVATCLVNVTNKDVNVETIDLTPNKKNIDVGSSTQVRVIIEPANATNRDLVWTSSDKNIATVDNNGVVRGLKSGIVIITAKTRNGKVVANTTITVNSKQIESLSFSDKEVSVKQDETMKLIVTINPSELSDSKLTWSSSNTNIVTIDENGIVKGIGIGSAVITVTSANGKKATCIVNVTKESVDVKKINLISNKKNIDIGSSTQISAVIEPANATNRDLLWTSSDKNIATVDNNGVVRGLKSGIVTITAKTKDGKVVATTTITINPKQIESITFLQSKYGVKKGNTLRLSVIVNPSELASSKFTWKSSNTDIVTVSENGIVKGINVGSAVITATSANGKKATCTIEVTNDVIEVEEIILTPNEEIVTVGDNTQIVAEIKPSNATYRDLVWTSSDKSIATVDNNGVVKGLKSGIVTITAKTKDGKIVANTTIEIVYDEELSIFDDDHTALTWNGSSNLKIFSKTSYTMNGKIAPESSNTYQFEVKNGTKYNIKYKMDFIETNQYNINMQYKLKKNDTYIIDHYVRPSELIIEDILLNSGENDTYYLEWKWISSTNDTDVGEGPEANYGLKIEITAEGTNE